MGSARGSLDIGSYKKAFLIYNPAARGLEGWRITEIDRAVLALREAGHRIDLVETEGPGTGARVARECVRSGADVILVAGGDGTVNEVANGMIHEAVPLGVLSAGTANMLGTELGLAGPLEKIAGEVTRWVPRRIPVGLLTTGDGLRRHFLMLAGAGLDAHVVRNVDPNLKKFQGKLAFWLAAFGELARPLEEFDVAVGGSTIRSSFALASRIRNYGATLALTPQAGLLRDDFAMAMFEGPKTYRYLEYLAGALANRLDQTSGVALLHATSAEFRLCGESPVYIQVDGEPAGCLPARIDLIPDAVTLLCPPEFR